MTLKQLIAERDSLMKKLKANGEAIQKALKLEESKTKIPKTVKSKPKQK